MFEDKQNSQRDLQDPRKAETEEVERSDKGGMGGKVEGVGKLEKVGGGKVKGGGQKGKVIKGYRKEHQIITQRKSTKLICRNTYI